MLNLMVRYSKAAAAISLLAFAPLAIAQPAAPKVREIGISVELQKKFEKDYGVREADFLKRDLQQSVDRSLGRALNTKVAWVNLTINDVKPNKPTFQQLSQNTSISYGESISIGGAKVEATLYDINGAVLGRVEHAWFSSDLRNITARSTWSDADYSFDRAANKIRKEAERAS